MAKRAASGRGDRRRKRRPKIARDGEGLRESESRASVAVTVAWTVSVTMVLVCNLLAIAVHFGASWVAEGENSQRIWLLGRLALVSGALMGAVAIGMSVLVFRVRRTAPPQGYVVFAALVSIAPILAVLILLLRSK